jgi:hypothetical protein
MARRTPLFIVASARPRLGKTLLARVLAEYFGADQRPVVAFDANPDEFALVDYLPAITDAATVNDTPGQVALFDDLLVSDQATRIVDLGHSQFREFFAIVEEIDFVREARRRGLMPVVLFLGDPDRRSRNGYRMLRERFPDVPLVPVLNDAVTHPARYRDYFPPTRKGGGPLRIPLLPPLLKGVIERPKFSFAALSHSREHRTTELYAWTRGMFLQFRELELRLLLDEIMPVFRFSA